MQVQIIKQLRQILMKTELKTKKKAAKKIVKISEPAKEKKAFCLGAGGEMRKNSGRLIFCRCA